MKTYTLQRQQWLPISLEKAWDFFSNPHNLSQITPASLDFRIISKTPPIISNGLNIEYTVKPILGIPMHWITLIEEVDAPRQFVDSQIKGPYRLWRHRHTFTAKDNGTLIEDIVEYKIGFSFLDPLIHLLIVGPQLKTIFDYRREVLQKRFP